MEKHCTWTQFDKTVNKPVFCGKPVAPDSPDSLCETHAEMARDAGMKECKLGHPPFWGQFCPECWHITFETTDTGQQETLDLGLALQHCVEALGEALQYVDNLQRSDHNGAMWWATMEEAKATLEHRDTPGVMDALQKCATALQEAAQYVESLDRDDHTAGIWFSVAREAEKALGEAQKQAQVVV